MKNDYQVLAVLWGFYFAAAAVAAEPVTAPSAVLPKWPVVETATGDSRVSMGRDEAMLPAKARQVLRERASLVTGSDGMIQLQFSESSRVYLGPGTRLELPGINWDHGDVFEALLKSGQIRWIGSKRSPTIVRSALFELSPPAGDFLLFYDPSAARAEIRVLQGEVRFGAVNGEDSVAVKMNQKASFQGVLEEGEIAYDMLLKGRKIPRGTLSPVTPMSEADLRPFRETAEREAQEKKRAAAEAAKVMNEAKRAGTICRSPTARFNECSWICEGRAGKGRAGGAGKARKACPADGERVNCVRFRCNANGAWTDRFVLPPDEGAQRCPAVATVGACDY